MTQIEIDNAVLETTRDCFRMLNHISSMDEENHDYWRLLSDKEYADKLYNRMLIWCSCDNTCKILYGFIKEREIKLK